MILDATQLESGSTLRGRICIIGAGAAGITLAVQFIGRGWPVILLESGGPRAEPATQALYEGQVPDGAMHPPLDRYRRRQFGGSTVLWGGRLAPFDPIDFSRRAWMPGEGWPIAYEAVARFYPEANRLCEAGDFDYAAPDAMPPLLPPGSLRQFTDSRLERFSIPTDFGARYRGRLQAARDVSVVLHANVLELRTAAQGARVAAAEVATLTGRRFSVQADIFVLASGGLEIPRLLLASRDAHANGIGNGNDQLGRHYMSHIAGTFGALRAGAVRNGYFLSPEGIYCRRRLALTAAAQERLGCGNFIARPHHPAIPDPAHRTGALSLLYAARPLIGYEYAKRLMGGAPLTAGRLLGHLRNLALDPAGAARFAAHLLLRRTLAARKFPSIVVRPKSGVFSLDFHAEQAPNPASRVQLCGETDALGMHRLRVEWRPSAIDLHTVRAAADALRADLAESGQGAFDFDPKEIEASSLLREGAYGGHHIGTARMSASARTGVVDAQCLVHGMRNLYLAGSAVFATSSQANPTLTIVALALRLAQHVEQMLAAPPADLDQGRPDSLAASPDASPAAQRKVMVKTVGPTYEVGSPSDAMPTGATLAALAAQNARASAQA